MIADTSIVSLFDGTEKPAIELSLESDLLSFRDKKLGAVRAKDRKIQNCNDVMCLLLSNGHKLLGDREQKVCVWQGGRGIYHALADIEIGMDLRAQAAGALTVVRVIGVLFFPRHQVRLVGFVLPNNNCFVVEGILCRS